ncbi:hypothetical protein OC846_005202 [Tilletia horrida]|uniref:gluconokinase n=1 Tax=Tilletia horrida TaxID=155126 RepID=A0AAN6GM98_9BASI|nr:hypothetical protein OC845_005299 [Tilletia horrida]KAK0546555.1 hypothetical protein OC846_005202 [Tilletia horrida]KAK0562328.1 hypothetical protein OC861_005368 [Tilletia horrida]
MVVDGKGSTGSLSPGVLIVVMGTSGTGKSTLGMSLSDRFGIPFVDGDDLHPSENVSKMSQGSALNDDDRLPWLLRVRHAAFEMTDDSVGLSSAVRQAEQERLQESGNKGLEESKARVRHMAEVLETSKQDITQEEERSDRDTQPGRAQEPDPKTSKRPRRACLIACSALKRKYRDLLRAHLGVDSYPASDDASSYEGQCLSVYFLYICVPEEELVRRMHDRKGHFMKESMLRSQLQTLEEPREDNEPGVLVLDGVGSKEEVERRAERLIEERVGLVCAPPSQK